MIYGIQYRIQAWLSRWAERCGVGVGQIFNEPGRHLIVRVDSETGRATLATVYPDRPFGGRNPYTASVRNLEEAITLLREWVELERIAGKEV